MPPTRVNPDDLSSETRIAIMILKKALALDAERLSFRGAQVTFDHVKASEWVPTIDVLWETK